MRTIFLLSCTKSKKANECKAVEMYSASNLFRKSLGYARKYAQDSDIFILSAKYGLLSLDDVITPYNQTLNKMDKKQRKYWSYKVLKQLSEKNMLNCKFVFLCGENYRKYLMQKLDSSCPIKQMLFGEQLRFYSQH